MRILDRLVLGTFIRLFAAFVIGAPLLFVIGDVVERLDRYLDRGIAPGQIALAYLYQLPQFFLWSFPIAGLIAVVFTVHGMTAHREIVAAKAGGISFHRLILPILLLGVLLTGAGFALAEVAPRATRAAADILEERRRFSDNRTDFAVQSEQGAILAVRRLSATVGTMESVTLARFRETDDGVETTLTSAHLASYEGDRGWRFSDGRIRLIAADGDERTFTFYSLRPAGLTEHPQELLSQIRHPDEMTRGELLRQIDILHRSGGRPHDLEVEYHEKSAIPVATLVILLFGAPLATSSQRGGTAFGVGVSLGSTILYLLLLRLAGALGSTGNLDPFLAAWLPNSLFLIAGIVLLLRVRT